MRNLTDRFIQETQAALVSFDVWDNEPTLVTDATVAARHADMLSAFADVSPDDDDAYTAAEIAWFRAPIGKDGAK